MKLSLLLLGTTGVLQAAIVNVNFTSGNGSAANVALDGTSADAPLAYTGTTWNDIGSANGGPFNDSNGNATTIGLAVDLNGNSGFNFSSGDAPNGILSNYLAPNISFSNPINEMTLTFSGLEADGIYSLAFVAQGDSVGQGSFFSDGGSISADSPGSDPTSELAEGVNFVVLAGVQANGSGELVITWDHSGTGTEAFAALNGLQIADGTIPEPSAALLGLCGALLLVRRRR